MNYLIVALICSGSSFLKDFIVEKKARKLGYVKEKEDFSQKMIEIGFMKVFIPLLPFVNVLSICFSLASSCLYAFGNDIELKEVYQKSYDFSKASKVKEEFEKYDFYTMADAMAIEGASKDVIREEISLAKRSVRSVGFSDKEFERLKAMCDAELCVEEAKLDVELTDEQEINLYNNFFKGFYNKKVESKILKKSLKIINKK